MFFSYTYRRGALTSTFVESYLVYLEGGGDGNCAYGGTGSLSGGT
jgi:hypothetical protein